MRNVGSLGVDSSIAIFLDLYLDSLLDEPMAVIVGWHEEPASRSMGVAEVDCIQNAATLTVPPAPIVRADQHAAAVAIHVVLALAPLCHVIPGTTPQVIGLAL